MNLTVVATPEVLKQQSEQSLQKILEACNEEQKTTLTNLLAVSETAHVVERALAVSAYLRKIFAAKPALLIAVLQDKNFYRDVDEAYFTDVMQAFTPQTDTELDNGLRYLRQCHMARFIMRDLSRLCSTEQLIKELSWFADACIEKALQWHYADMVKIHGFPIGRYSEEPQQLVVLGMGKLGAYELNLSSDIDLIFCYPEGGQTDGRKVLDNHQFFMRVGQKIIKSLDRITIDGFVFRVDMRLRPYGQSGALALNFDATELYYAEQGREWERYAMIKARCVAGDKKQGDALLRRLRPFVYRKYTDFSAIQALREMKALINREVRRLGKQDDVKLGAGGIREIEFIAQSYQLIYGGRDEKLQQRSLLAVLSYLGQKKILPPEATKELKEAYLFLRNAEHAIQALNDEQTQRLPVDEESLLRVACALGYSNSQDFMHTLDGWREKVRGYFEKVVAEQNENNDEEISEWRQIWLENDEHFEQSLKEQGFNDEECRILLQLKNDSRLARMETVSRERFETFMPNFLSEVAAVENRGEAVSGLVALIEAVLRRTSYLVLLNENPHALERLVTIATASPWIMQQLAKQPVLLDELLNNQGLGQVPDVKELRELLRQQGLRLPVEDQEAHMQMLRYFRLAHHLHIVAAEASGKLPLMKVSDYLTFLAEAILEYTLNLSWLQTVEKYGYPTRDGVAITEPEFVIVGYGKLGGIELSHSSDLDLIFLFDADDGATEGDKTIENKLFYTRMGQRIIHILTTRTMLGHLYEVDMRLRPSGGKGLLVSTIDAFEKYQHSQAWTWEHQALVRARGIAGHQGLAERFYRIRDDVLMQPREIEKLRREVVEMRQKMHDHLAPANARGESPTVFHLKHSRGGIVDIEFMVQFAVLAWSGQHPSIAYFSDNIRILENLGSAGLISREEAQSLIDVYRLYRSQVHKLALRQEKSEVPAEQFAAEREIVLAMWHKLLID